MIAWMMYTAVVGILLAGAAAAVDRLARLAGRPTRWIWIAAIVASVALAAVARYRTIGSHTITTYTGGYSSAPYAVSAASSWWTSFQLGFAGVRRVLDAPLITGAAALSRLPASTNAFALGAWLLASAGLTAVLLLVHMRFARAARRWPLGELHGTLVRLSPSTGPVVIGLTRPEIVVPRWLLDRSAGEQGVVLDHEGEHIKAGDAFVLVGACAAVALMPWNAALWYMLRRIRLAVELDCDARVLRRGVSVSIYGTLLIDLAEQALPLRLTAAALADDTSHLHQRIIAMKPQVSRFVWLRGGAAAALGLVGLLAACEAKMPTESDIKQMDAASAERAARQYSIVGAKDSVIYTIDGATVSEQTAKKLSAEKIDAINVEKHPGSTSTIAIHTKGAPVLLNDLVVRRRGDSTELDGVLAKSRLDENQALKLRGANASGIPALVIIDGVRTSEAALGKIVRDNIESVEVLKGKAAAETYGPDADHGVIIVKTKGK
jgi:beta-lactamase regulating signal transducer with metallopeptidase domain